MLIFLNYLECSWPVTTVMFLAVFLILTLGLIFSGLSRLKVLNKKFRYPVVCCWEIHWEERFQVNKFQLFVIRAIIGIAFSVLLIRFFYPNATVIHIAGLAVFIVGLAYVLEYFRLKDSE